MAPTYLLLCVCVCVCAYSFVPIQAGFSFFFCAFPPLWYFVLGHGGVVGKPIFDEHGNCSYVPPTNGTVAQLIVFPNGTNMTIAAIDPTPGVLTCGWASFWHVYWFSLFYGLCFLSVFALLLGRWAHLDAMYDCPCYGAEIRQTWANRMAIYSMIMGYYAFCEHQQQSWTQHSTAQHSSAASTTSICQQHCIHVLERD